MSWEILQWEDESADEMAKMLRNMYHCAIAKMIPTQDTIEMPVNDNIVDLQTIAVIDHVKGLIILNSFW